MNPLKIDSFKPDKIKAVSSDQKSVDNLSYTSYNLSYVKFEYVGDKMPPIRIDGTFRIFKFKNSKGTIYSLSIVIAINFWKNSSMNYERLLPRKPVDWFRRS